ncbi:neurobeachin-like protein 1, partial [Dinothrombium tinctorium]
NIPSKCIHTLYGHDSEISSVCVCVELDTIVTASINSIINIYTLVEGIYMHTLNTEQPVNCLKINCFGHIISQCGSRNIDVYSINGRHLYSLSNNDKEVSQVNCMETLEDYLIVGEADGYLKVYEVYNMKLINVIPLESSILYITLFNNLSYFSHILVALENSKIAVLTVDAIRKLQTL